MTKLLVTGGCGFIGSALCRHVVQNLDWSVVNVDSLTYASTLDSTNSLHSTGRYVHEKEDITDAAAMKNVFAAHQPDMVAHLAAESHVDRSIDGPMAFVKTNVIGTAVLLDAARAYRASLPDARSSSFRFLHVSTDEVYGSLLMGDPAFTELSTYDPSSPYSASKAASDHIARAYGRTYGLPVLVSNCSNNYGPYQFPEKLIPLMIAKALSGERLPIYGEGLNVRDWLYVEDHARALAMILERGVAGQTYNIGGDSERTNLDVVHAICDILDAKLGDAVGQRRKQIGFVADRPGHDLRYAVDSAKIQRELGWQPSVTFDVGMEKTISWYLENTDWWQSILRGGAYDGTRVGAAKQAAIS
jgi:dTDP-glucose 4,6-dehydratase